MKYTTGNNATETKQQKKEQSKTKNYGLRACINRHKLSQKHHETL